MKKITNIPIYIFIAIFSISTLVCIAITYLILHKLIHLPFEYEFFYFIFFSFILIVKMIINLRIWLHFFPTPIGKVLEKNIWHVHIYQLFYLLIINPITSSRLLPTPLMRTLYQSLGAKMGTNSYCNGTICDAHLVKMGANCIIGDKALLTPHQIESHKLGYYPIILGNDVTVGAHAVVLGGVTIEDNGIVAAGAIVSKGTYIKKGEILAGIPARLLKTTL